MATYICTACGWEGERKKIVRGSRLVEKLIWTFLLLPGPLYSFWRRSGRSDQCPHCQMPTLAKEGSEAGRLARRRFEIELGLHTPRAATKKEEPRDPLASFGQEKPAGEPVKRKPVNPDEW